MTDEFELEDPIMAFDTDEDEDEAGTSDDAEDTDDRRRRGGALVKTPPFGGVFLYFTL
ncbi:MAG: hypothetical protein V4436_03830 [Patescibacteria group bacterium]